jgi:hypothetical protein
MFLGFAFVFGKNVYGIVTGGKDFLAHAYKSSGTCLLSCLGNLFTKNRLRDRFSGSKSRQVTGQRFAGPNFRQESRTGFQGGDRILNRMQYSLFKQNRVPCPA